MGLTYGPSRTALLVASILWGACRRSIATLYIDTSIYPIIRHPHAASVGLREKQCSSADIYKPVRKSGASLHTNTVYHIGTNRVLMARLPVSPRRRYVATIPLANILLFDNVCAW